jgi:hypothetical protein
MRVGNWFIMIRVTKDQKARIIRAASKLGLGASTWLRQLGLDAARRAAHRDDDEPSDSASRT